LLGRSATAKLGEMPTNAARKTSMRWWAGVSSLVLACSGSIDPGVPDARDAGLPPGIAAGGSGTVPPPPAAGAGGSSGDEDAGPSKGGSSAIGPGGSGGAGGSASDAPVCDAVSEVFLPSCGTGSCHSNPGATIGDFGVGRAEAEALVDVPSRKNVACGVFIDSSNPAESLLLRKLTGDFSTAICGGKMPLIGRDLTRDEIACVASWLEQFRR
jgi:hypothetical protein